MNRYGVTARGCYRRSGGQPRTRMRDSSADGEVAIIGAGSVEFTRGILADLCAYEELHGTLRIARTISTRTDWPTRSEPGASSSRAPAPATRSRRTGSSIGLRRRRLPDQRDPGRCYAATRTDFDIPRDFGVLQTIGDTIGIGGIMRGLGRSP